jgi:alkylhydroperoxidase family enzyme
MPRLSQVPRAAASDALRAFYDQTFGAGRDPVADPGTATGTPGNWWTVWGQTPDVLKAFSAYSMGASPLDPQLRELALTRTGYACGSQFVFSQHCKGCRRVGVDEAKIAALPYWNVADGFTEAERAVLAFVDAQILERGRVHDEVFARLRRALSEEHILMLTYFIGMYNFHATATKALRLEYDDVPERVVEIPAPDSPGVQDWRDPKWTGEGR